MAELTPYTPRSQMSMDLLKAISEPKMTAQDLARQEDERRAEEHGVYRKPTQMENVFEGVRKTTGLDPRSLEQTPLDRTMLAGQWATDLVNPGKVLGGKAMMPAIAPLVTKAGRWFKTAPLPEYNEKLFNTELNKEMRFLNKRMRDVHDLGPHLGRNTEMGAAFYDWYPNYGKAGQPAENFLKGPRGSTVQARILGKGVRVPDIGDDYEQVGRFISNDVFEDRNLFKRWMTQNSKSPHYLDNLEYTKHLGEDNVDLAWKRLSKSTPKKDRGGYVSYNGGLHSKDYLKTEMAKFNKDIREFTTKLRKGGLSRFKEENIRNQLAMTRLQKSARRNFLKPRYVDDFGSYLKKAELIGPQWEDLVQGPFPGSYGREVAERFAQNMRKKGITNIKYKNTNLSETKAKDFGNIGSGVSYQRPEFKNTTATMVLDVDALEPAWKKATGKEMLRSKTKDWFSKSGRREQYGLWRTLKDVIGR